MVLTLLAPPAYPAVTLAEAKAHLRITHEAEDDLVSELIVTADRFLTGDTGMALVNQTFRLGLSDWPNGPVPLPRQPVQSIASVTVFDRDGTPHLLDASAIHLDIRARPNCVAIDPSQVTSGPFNGIDIDFVSGFGPTPVEVPGTLRQAVLHLVAHWYEFRGVFGAGDQPVSIPATYARLVRPWRQMRL